jgi:hypothetical protein
MQSGNKFYCSVQPSFLRRMYKVQCITPQKMSHKQVLLLSKHDDDRLWSKHVNQINFTLHSCEVLVICFMT